MRERKDKARSDREDQLVEDAGADSFPASDPPTYAIGKKDVPDIVQPIPSPTKEERHHSPSAGEGDEG